MATNAEPLEVTMRNLLAALPNRVRTDNIHMISRIPVSVRHHHDDLYNPLLVAIGPYHDHNENKFKEMEEYKHHFLCDLLDRNQQVNLEDYINTLRNLKDQARGCYSESTDYLTDDKFVQMLLLDGCFILEFLLKLEENCLLEWDFMTTLFDLLLIENQIPFVVLEELLATSKFLDGNQSPADLKSLVVNNLFVAYLGDGIQSNCVRESWNQIGHLLHLYHEVSLPNPLTRGVQTNTMLHVSQRQKDRGHLVIPSATELLEFGFILRKQNSINNCDATYSGDDVLKIPRLIIDSNRQRLLMNLLAFEQRLVGSRKRWTGLMVMMKCMVKNTSDLEILQSRSIVQNLLSSEEEAIQFFGQLSKTVTLDFNNHYFLDLFEEINMLCGSMFRQHRAKLLRDYFNNPWAIISFSSSMVALTLTVVQTIISVLAFYNSRSYGNA